MKVDALQTSRPASTLSIDFTPGPVLDRLIGELAGYRVEQIDDFEYILFSPDVLIFWAGRTPEDAWAQLPQFSRDYYAYKALEGDMLYMSVKHREMLPDDTSQIVYDVYLCPEEDADSRYMGSDTDGRIAWLKAYVAMKLSSIVETTISLAFLGVFVFAVIDALT